MGVHLKLLVASTILFAVFLPSISSGDISCDVEVEQGNKGEALKFKLASIASILLAGAVGVSLPLLATRIEFLSPENDMFFMIKAFAAGVILATGFLHILPDAFLSLSSPCLDENPWAKFPFAGFVAMIASIGTLMIDTVATNFYKKMHFHKTKQVNVEGGVDEHGGHVPLHTHTSHGHAHGAAVPSSSSHELSTLEIMKQRVVSQVLELGIVVHSVIIGMSLGASQSPETIRPLLAALSFHQFFEGLGLGSCLSQAKFESLSTSVMAVCFSLTTPVGIGIGMAVTSVYKENSPTALIVEGIFNSASAGVLIYMSLVDLLASDFTNPRMQSSVRLQLGAHISLLLGAGCMSFMARWT